MDQHTLLSVIRPTQCNHLCHVHAQDAEDQAKASVNSSLTYMPGPALQLERKGKLFSSASTACCHWPAVEYTEYLGVVYQVRSVWALGIGKKCCIRRPFWEGRLPGRSTQPSFTVTGRCIFRAFVAPEGRKEERQPRFSLIAGRKSCKPERWHFANSHVPERLVSCGRNHLI